MGLNSLTKINRDIFLAYDILCDIICGLEVTDHG